MEAKTLPELTEADRKLDKKLSIVIVLLAAAALVTMVGLALTSISNEKQSQSDSFWYDEWLTAPANTLGYRPLETRLLP